jgi:hypothetical protein
MALRAASATTSSGPVREQHGQRLHEHRRGGGVQRRRLLQPTLNQPQRRIGAGTRALAQATDHLDRCGILGIDGREREHPQTQVADGSGERASSPKHGWTVGGPPGSHLGRGRRLVLLRAALEQPARIHRWRARPR